MVLVKFIGILAVSSLLYPVALNAAPLASNTSQATISSDGSLSRRLGPIGAFCSANEPNDLFLFVIPDTPIEFFFTLSPGGRFQKIFLGDFGTQESVFSEVSNTSDNTREEIEAVISVPSGSDGLGELDGRSLSALKITCSSDLKNAGHVNCDVFYTFGDQTKIRPVAPSEFEFVPWLVCASLLIPMMDNGWLDMPRDAFYFLHL